MARMNVVISQRTTLAEKHGGRDQQVSLTEQPRKYV